VAEAEEVVVLVPDVLEVAEVEVEVSVRVGVHVRHPMVAVGIPSQAMCDISPESLSRAPAPLCILLRVFPPAGVLAGTSHRLI